MNFISILIVLTCVLCLQIQVYSVPLNEWITHYEPIEYDATDIDKVHTRAKRSVTNNADVHLHFKSHGRSFNIRLKRDLKTFSDKLEVIGSHGDPEDFDTSHIYQGHILGEPGSHVFGSLMDGVFDGKIVSPHTGAYYVERAHKYFPNASRPGIAPTPDTSVTFHSIIYHEKNVIDPFKHRRTGHVGGCGITEDVSQWMERIQNSAVEDEDQAPPLRPKREVPSARSILDGDERPEFKYTRPANVDNDRDYEGSRSKRATRFKGRYNNNTCSLFIQTDPLIWRHVSEQMNHDREKTREEILSLIAQHVTAVNFIYRDTKFDGRMEHRNIKFEVQRIKIDDDIPCRNTYFGEGNPFCMENIDVSNFLNLHSLGNHEDFCLAYVFTYRDFTGGTLGLAWVASASGASGGICEKFKTYTETIGGLYQSTKRSLNTGIITFVNYNSRVPPKVSQLTLAHEIGHNFGSPHDYPQECRPGGDKGNFIMFASATSGDRPNNSKFSQCSVGNISNVLDAIEESKKRNCFTDSAGAFCGNKIVEEGEECDCGYNDEECTDSCCYPRTVSAHDKLQNNSAQGCTRRARTQCSPSEGPCCRADCKFVQSHERSVCRIEGDCSYPSTCNGRKSQCPESPHKRNFTRCNEDTQLCINGECTGSICLIWNMQECFLTSHLGNVDKRKLCELACQNGSNPQTCRSTSEFAAQVNLPPGGISLRPGSPCDNFQGYCDVFFKCRAVDAEGPLARLKNLLFNRETLLSVAQWVTEYWWAVSLIAIAFVVVMGSFIKCCAVHTPSSNPNKPAARRISETLRRPMNTLRRMHNRPHGPPSRGAGPARGYGEGRGRHYSHKPSAPPATHSRNHQELYASAYGGGGRSSGSSSSRQNEFELRHQKV